MGVVALRSERDVIEALAGSEVTVADIYDAVRDAGVADRDRGLEVIWGRTDQRFKRRARTVLQQLAAQGRAERTGPGRWLIDGSRSRPRRMLLFVPSGPPGVAELHLMSAVELLESLACTGVRVDLVLCDPPWGLGRQTHGVVDPSRSERPYARDSNLVVPGYVDVAAGDYRAFTRDWISAAHGLLGSFPGTQLAVITGPQQSAAVQVAAEDAGFGYVNQVVVRRPFPMFTSRRFAHAHTVVTVLEVPGANRFFSCPPELPKARSGRDYPTDWWADIPKHERRGLLRYDNMLAPELVSRVVRSLTPGPDNGGVAWEALVVDPFAGGGTIPAVCVAAQRRVVAGDVNVDAVRFSAARMLVEPVASPVPRDPVPAHAG